MEILIIILLVLLNGVFSMAEMSLVSARKFKLETAQKKGSKNAKIALELSENPTRFLSTVQIGITLIGILLGIYSGENLTEQLKEVLAGIAILKPYAHGIAVVTILVLVTYLSIVLGELLPKRLGLTFPEPIAMFLALPMKYLSMFTSPFVWLLTKTNDIILNIFGIKQNTENIISEAEIKSIVRDSADGGEIQEIEQDIVQRVFELGDRKVNTLLTHKSDVVFLEENDDFQTVCKKITSEKHSAYPVCKDGDFDDIIGIVMLKNLFAHTMENKFELKTYVTPVLFINKSMYAYRLLEMFKKERIHYAIVVDEYGSTLGLITMDDVIDALVGDVSELNHQDEYEIVQRDDKTWLIDGQYPIIDFMKYFDLEIEKSPNDSFVTIAGLIIARFHSLPKVGDKIQIEGFELEVIDKDGQRIDKILLTKL